MSTVSYFPNGEGNPPEYKIGTMGIEFPKPKGFFDFLQNISTYLGMTTDVIIPAYGLWAGPGWAEIREIIRHYNISRMRIN